MFFQKQLQQVWRHAKKTAPQRRRKLIAQRQPQQLEILEQRCLLAASTLTPSEQLMLELTNRARANPAAEATRQGIALNQGLAPNTISAAAKQPLAPNNTLGSAADGHTADMFARGFFRHTSPNPGSTTFDQRVTSAGYTYTTVGENLALQEYTTLNQTTVTTEMYNGLYASSGHRTNIMNNQFLEVGVGINYGSFTDNDNVIGGGTRNVGLTTTKFGTQADQPYITGVVYTDATSGALNDSFYSIGEAAGSGGTVTATDTSSGATFTETIGAAGGYSLLVPAGTYNVTVSGGGLAETYGQNNVVVGSSNVKVDFETTTASIATIVLATPTIATVHNSSTTNQQFTLDWNAVSGANRYEVSYTYVATGQASYVNEFSTTNSFTPSAALPIGRYNIWVRVNGTDGATSPWSTPVSVQVNTAPNLNSLAANPTTQRPSISWSAITGATRYEVWGTNVTTQVSRAFNDANITGTTYTPSADLEMGVYRVWVRAFDASGLGTSWSDSRVFNIGPQLVAPVIPTFTTTPQFSWTSISGADSYQLYVQRGSTVVINESAITTNTFTPTSALTSGDYRWWVRPFTAAGRGGAWTALGEFNVDGRPVVLSPTGTTTDGGPAITWTAVSGATSYEVYLFNDDTPGLVTRQTGITTTSFTAPALVNGNYRVWVRAFQAGGTNGTWSRAAAFVVNASTVSLPVTLISPLAPTLETAPRFEWSNVAGAVTYDLYLHNGTTAIIETGITGTTHTPSTALAIGEWQWWVRAVNAAGAVGAWSIVGETDVSGRPVLIAPTTTISDTTPTFTWTAVAGATRYSIQVDSVTTGQSQLIREDNITTNSYTPTTALATGAYRFWVQAIDGTTGNRSPWSFSVDFAVAAIDVDDFESGPEGGLLSIELSPLVVNLQPSHLPTTAKIDGGSDESTAEPPHHTEDSRAASVDRVVTEYNIDVVMDQLAKDGISINHKFQATLMPKPQEI